MNKLEENSQSTNRQVQIDDAQRTATGEENSESSTLTQSFAKHLAQLRDWPAARILFDMPVEPHRVVFWSCPWAHGGAITPGWYGNSVT